MNGKAVGLTDRGTTRSALLLLPPQSSLTRVKCPLFGVVIALGTSKVKRWHL